MSRPTDGPGACHTACAKRHLEKFCNELGRSSIAKRTNDEIKMKKTIRRRSNSESQTTSRGGCIRLEAQKRRGNMTENGLKINSARQMI